MKLFMKVREAYAHWWAKCGHPDAPPIQIQACKEAFYSGAAAMWGQVRAVIGNPDVTDAEVLAYFDDRRDEFERFFRGLLAGRN